MVQPGPWTKRLGPQAHGAPPQVQHADRFKTTFAQERGQVTAHPPIASKRRPAHSLPSQWASDRLCPHPRVLAQWTVRHGPRRPAWTAIVVHGPLAHSCPVWSTSMSGPLVRSPLVHAAGPRPPAGPRSLVHGSPRGPQPAGPVVHVDRVSGLVHDVVVRPAQIGPWPAADGRVWPCASYPSEPCGPTRRATDAVHGERDGRAGGRG
jgi:hypothetical protein